MDNMQCTIMEECSPVIFTGFDGYVDKMVKIIYSVQEKTKYFESISNFGSYLCSKGGKSCSLEMEKIVEQGGGNSAVFAKAMLAMGCRVICVGAYGYPEVESVFETSDSNMELYSISNPGYCTALEFDDGKVMLAENGDINKLNYEILRERIGEKKIIELMNESDVFSFMNWSEMPGCTDIWRGILKNILPLLKTDKKQKIFIDISDCSRRLTEDIEEMLELIRKFSTYRSVVFSLNRNEFETIYTRVWKQELKDFKAAGENVRSRTGAEVLVVHETDSSTAVMNNNFYKVENIHIENPLFSTGGGDNFNAGLVYGLVRSVDIVSAMKIANAVSGYYITNGKSPDKQEIVQYLKKQP